MVIYDGNSINKDDFGIVGSVSWVVFDQSVGFYGKLWYYILIFRLMS